jgi:multidrug resistance efflux pump
MRERAASTYQDSAPHLDLPNALRVLREVAEELHYEAGRWLASIDARDAEIEHLTRERDEAQASNDALDEKIASLAPHGSCACSYDHPGDVCEHHSPKLRAALKERDEAREREEATRRANVDCVMHYEAMQSELTATQKEVEKLREALKPFAAAAPKWHGFQSSLSLTNMGDSLCVAHLRRAHAALAQGGRDGDA